MARTPTFSEISGGLPEEQKELEAGLIAASDAAILFGPLHLEPNTARLASAPTVFVRLADAKRSAAPAASTASLRRFVSHAVKKETGGVAGTHRRTEGRAKDHAINSRRLNALVFVGDAKNKRKQKATRALFPQYAANVKRKRPEKDIGDTYENVSANDAEVNLIQTRNANIATRAGRCYSKLRQPQIARTAERLLSLASKGATVPESIALESAQERPEQKRRAVSEQSERPPGWQRLIKRNMRSVTPQRPLVLLSGRQSGTPHSVQPEQKRNENLEGARGTQHARRREAYLGATENTWSCLR
jgi:hypothetical protein